MSRRSGRVNLLTSVVLGAAERLERDAEAAAKAYAKPGFMKREVDPRTLDRHVQRMSAEDMAELAARDPDEAEELARRRNLLDQRAATRVPPPGEAEYEPI